MVHPLICLYPLLLNFLTHCTLYDLWVSKVSLYFHIRPTFWLSTDFPTTSFLGWTTLCMLAWCCYCLGWSVFCPTTPPLFDGPQNLVPYILFLDIYWCWWWGGGGGLNISYRKYQQSMFCFCSPTYHFYVVTLQSVVRLKTW